MAGTTGLEPATSDVTGQRSDQLSYVPLVRKTSDIRSIAQQAAAPDRNFRADFVGIRGTSAAWSVRLNKQQSNDRPGVHRGGGAFLFRVLVFCAPLRPVIEGSLMDYLLSGLVAALVFGYLMYALLNPERF